MVVDLSDIQWWHWFIAAITALGLSPAPWLAGLAANKIQFTTPAQQVTDARLLEQKTYYEQRLLEQKTYYDDIREIDAKNYAEMKESRDGYRVATKEERERANKATETVGSVLEAIQTMNHVLLALNQAAEEVRNEHG